MATKTHNLCPKKCKFILKSGVIIRLSYNSGNKTGGNFYYVDSK